jgi:putative restriction endonuclease
MRPGSTLPGPGTGKVRSSAIRGWPAATGPAGVQGQGAGGYDRRCALTGSKIRPVLQAAHIRPVTDGGEHRLDDELLLRSDVHALFDHGYLGVDPGYRLHVSLRLREEFRQGEQFYERARQAVALLTRRADWPGGEFLEWHLDTIFKAS